MKIKEYMSNMKEIYKLLLQYIENEGESDDDYDNLIECFTKQKIIDNRDDLKNFFHLLSKVSRNHFRNSNFNSKIEKIILYNENSIKQTFSNTEIFDIFKNSKQILLLLIKNKIITLDKDLSDLILYQGEKQILNMKYQLSKYHYYFYTEIEPFLDPEKKTSIKNELIETDSQIFDDFDKKRLNGENDSHICQLIRNDSIVDFITYVNRTNYPLTSTIPFSFFETNYFLLKTFETTLIQYAAFYGSIQIFQYLKNNNIELKPSLWIYAIHSKNPELIHILEENHLESDDKTFKNCFINSLKCHHNDIANYVKDNLLTSEIETPEKDFEFNFLALCLHFHNFEFFPKKYENNYLFYYACKYDYLSLVKLLFSIEEFKINDAIISFFFFFFV